MSSRNKEIDKIIKALKAQGWRAEKKNHWKLYSPDGEHIVVISSSPKSTETKKIRADCIRAGATL